MGVRSLGPKASLKAVNFISKKIQGNFGMKMGSLSTRTLLLRMAEKIASIDCASAWMIE